MPIWTTGASAANTSIGQVPKTRCTTVRYSVNGLMPNSRYTFWVNGVDMTWACRISGTKLGSGLLSDEFGSITVLFAAEISADYGSGSTTKYHNMSLRDVNGNVRAVSLTGQQLAQK